MNKQVIWFGKRMFVVCLCNVLFFREAIKKDNMLEMSCAKLSRSWCCLRIGNIANCVHFRRLSDFYVSLDSYLDCIY